ncbi:MAG: cytochrome c biogenesis protein ResB [Desulfobulbaceae bacterium]
MSKQRTTSSRSFLDRFISPNVVLWLFALLVILLVPSTFFPESAAVLRLPVKAVLLLLGSSLTLCTLRRLKTLRISTLVIHLGALLILVGGLISSFAFVATVNIYEGTSTDTVFDWGVEKDVPLGFDLRVARINTAFHPVEVKVGILRNGRQAELVLTRTGDTFGLDGYRVRVGELDPRARTLALAVESADGRLVGTLTTSGRRDLPPGFPLDFRLVAFRDPVLKRVWVDLALHKDGELLATGTSEVNQPLRWQGMQFFLTRVEADQSGRPYAGIQISRDPGIPLVYAGFVVLGLGLLLHLGRWPQLRG